MQRRAKLFDDTGGSSVRAFLELRRGNGNIPPAWIERSAESRRQRQAELTELLAAQSIDAIVALEDWEKAYEKECFYRGIRILLELERKGGTKL